MAQAGSTIPRISPTWHSKARLGFLAVTPAGAERPSYRFAGEHAPKCWGLGFCLARIEKTRHHDPEFFRKTAIRVCMREKPTYLPPTKKRYTRRGAEESYPIATVHQRRVVNVSHHAGLHRHAIHGRACGLIGARRSLLRHRDGLRHGCESL